MTSQIITFEQRCKAAVYKVLDTVKSNGGYRCMNKVKLDGWCGLHHPDKVAARNKKTQERFNKKIGSIIAEKDLYKKALDFYALKDQVMDLINETINHLHDKQDQSRVKDLVKELKIKMECEK